MGVFRNPVSIYEEITYKKCFRNNAANQTEKQKTTLGNESVEGHEEQNFKWLIGS